jgi:hypothetical protein
VGPMFSPTVWEPAQAAHLLRQDAQLDDVRLLPLKVQVTQPPDSCCHSLQRPLLPLLLWRRRSASWRLLSLLAGDGSARGWPRLAAVQAAVPAPRVKVAAAAGPPPLAQLFQSFFELVAEPEEAVQIVQLVSGERARDCRRRLHGTAPGRVGHGGLELSWAAAMGPPKARVRRAFHGVKLRGGSYARARTHASCVSRELVATTTCEMAA